MPDSILAISGSELQLVRAVYADFLSRFESSSANYKLTSLSDASAYARCFWVFGQRLLRNSDFDRDRLAVAMRADIRTMRRAYSVTPKNKPYRQLLTFTLSALAALRLLDEDPLADLVEEQIQLDLVRELCDMGCLAGNAGSGNQAMFMAIFLLHGRDWLNLDTQSLIDIWVELHLENMNAFGFWGNQKRMTHLQFQNGYHQHEIFEYLSIENPRKEAMIAAVRSLSDVDGHFAPYPGGGGCYDYDAVFLLTPEGRVPDEPSHKLLLRTTKSVIASQNLDGGFCESQFVRPRSVANLRRFMRHIMAARNNSSALQERLRYGLTLQRRKHDRIHTHWSQYARRWNESDLWDGWFRMLTLARIEVALDPTKATDWGFIDYPGIGFHPLLRV